MATVKFSPLSFEDVYANSLGPVTSSELERNSRTGGTGLVSDVFGPVEDFMCQDCKVAASIIVQNEDGTTERACGICHAPVASKTVREDIRSYVKLNIPIINPLRGGENGELIARILGIPARVMRDIVNCTVGYDIETGEFINPNTSNVSKRYVLLFQGEIVLHLLNLPQYSIENMIQEVFQGIMKDAFFAIKTELVDIGRVSTEPSDYYLTGGYYFHFSSYAHTLLKRGRQDIPTQEEVEEAVHAQVIKGVQNRLCLLLECTKEKIQSMIMTYVRVTPAGTRPDVNKRRHPHTLAYNNVVRYNNAYEMVGGTVSPVSRASAIRKLYTTIYHLLIGNMANSDPRFEDSMRSMVETIIGKEGHIRGKMLGKRQDWSGRSVIIVDPNIKIDECSIPFEMAKMLYRYHLALKGVDLGNDAEIRSELISRVLPTVPIMLNRAPTLHRPSFQAFRVILSDKRTIGLHPLVCRAYNADFDGDQMAAYTPLSEAAIDEANELMLSMNNIHIPANGDVSIVPSQELVYGLFELSRFGKDNTSGRRVTGFNSNREVYEGIMAQMVRPDDIVTVEGNTDTAGRLALRHCFPRDMWDSLSIVSKDNIGKTFAALTNRPAVEYRDYIALVTDIAFAVATSNAPTLQVLNNKGTKMTDSFYGFNKEVSEFEKEYHLGFETEEEYNRKYDEAYGKVQSHLEGTISEEIGRDNGYVAMVESGARGTQSNLMQIFAAKGRIAQSSTKAFNMIITTPLVGQLTALESFVSAYGTRKTMIDKVHKTGQTGEAMRNMSHTTSQSVIRYDDCGTLEGLTITVRDLARTLPKTADDKPDLDKAKAALRDIVVGRYEVGTNILIDEDKADKLANQGVATIRTVLTCKAHICSKCYGTDLTYQREAVVGLPVGFIAAQSIGEPGTQLTMKTFHSGGVATKHDVTSAFDRMRALISMSDRTKFERYPTYDPLAWDSGEITTESRPDNVKRVYIGESKRRYKDLPATALLKDKVTLGEGICGLEGEHDIKEMIRIVGFQEAQKYLLLSLYSIYVSQANINFKHFEVLVDGMTRYVCVDTVPGHNIKVGMTVNTSEIAKYSSTHKFVPTLVGVNVINVNSHQPLGQLSFNRQVRTLQQASFYGQTDSLTEPYNRAMVGLPPESGTFYPDYMGRRRMALQSSI